MRIIKKLAAVIVLVMIALLSVAGCTINVFPTPSSSPTPQTNGRTGESWTSMELSDYYPTTLAVNHTGRVTVEVFNHENADADYKLVVNFANKTINSTSFSLLNNQTWKNSIAFMPTQRGLGQKINFDLYKVGDPDVYRNVYLYINVT